MTEKHIKVSLTVDDRKVTLEGPEDFVKAEVQRMTASLTPLKAVSRSPQTTPATAVGPTERELIAAKRPTNQIETVAVLGFCLTEGGQPEFTEADIKKAYIRAGVRPPKVISQAIRDAKNKLDYIAAGKKRGTYQLSPHGDRTVRFDMPRAKASK